MLGRLGHEVNFRTALGNDDHGDELRRWLVDSGVEVDITEVARTGTIRNRVHRDGSVHHELDLSWTLGDSPLVEPQHVRTGAIGVWLTPGTWRVEGLLERAREGATISFDPKISPDVILNASEARRRIERIANLSDIIKLSEEDVHWLRPGQPEQLVATDWIEAGAAMVVVTGKRGDVTAYSEGSVLRVSDLFFPEIQGIDAGDMSMATLIHNLLKEDLLGARNRQQLRRLNESVFRSILSTPPSR